MVNRVEVPGIDIILSDSTANATSFFLPVQCQWTEGINRQHSRTALEQSVKLMEPRPIAIEYPIVIDKFW